MPAAQIFAGSVRRVPFDPRDMDRADWPLLTGVGINLVWRKHLLEEHLQALGELGYALHRFRFKDLDSFKAELSGALQWKAQFGYEPWSGNLDALNDGFPGNLFDASDRNAFCIEDFHVFVKADRPMAEGVLDILADQVRFEPLGGKRLVVLIRTDDATYVTPALAPLYGGWTQKEWFTRSRGL